MVRSALLQSGFILEDPHEMHKPIEELVRISLDIPVDEAPEEIDFSISEDEADTPSENDDEEKGEVEDVDEPEEEGEEGNTDENVEEYYEGKGLNPDGTPKDDEEDQADDNNNDEDVKDDL